MNDILAPTMLAEAVFGLNDDAFMMFMVVFLLLCCALGFGVAVVFRDKGMFGPAAESSEASSETPLEPIEDLPVATAVANAPDARGASEAFIRITEKHSVVETQAIPNAQSVAH